MSQLQGQGEGDHSFPLPQYPAQPKQLVAWRPAVGSAGAQLPQRPPPPLLFPFFDASSAGPGSAQCAASAALYSLRPCTRCSQHSFSHSFCGSPAPAWQSYSIPVTIRELQWKIQQRISESLPPNHGPQQWL